MKKKKDETIITLHVPGKPPVTATAGQMDQALKELEKENKEAIGHNSKKLSKAGGVAVEQLRSIIARVERLEEEKAGIGADISQVFAEAKGNGFDIKAIRAIIKLRKTDASEREEQEAILDTYLHALGMLEPDLLDGQDEPEDKLYPTAVEIVTRDGKASPSYLQRVMTIGYNRAASLIERMELEGIVGPANHVGKREILNSSNEKPKEVED